MGTEPLIGQQFGGDGGDPAGNATDEPMPTLANPLMMLAGGRGATSSGPGAGGSNSTIPAGIQSYTAGITASGQNGADGVSIAGGRFISGAGGGGYYGGGSGAGPSAVPPATSRFIYGAAGGGGSSYVSPTSVAGVTVVGAVHSPAGNAGVDLGVHNPGWITITYDCA